MSKTQTLYVIPEDRKLLLEAHRKDCNNSFILEAIETQQLQKYTHSKMDDVICWLCCVYGIPASRPTVIYFPDTGKLALQWKGRRAAKKKIHWYDVFGVFGVACPILKEVVISTKDISAVTCKNCLRVMNTRKMKNG